MILSNLQYPIGKFQKPENITKEILSHWISEIASFPERLLQEVEHLSDEQLDTPYRENGWTIRQVVHHCADSHINAFIRLKLALTEENPVIKPYLEARWGELPDCKTLPIGSSIKILEGIHERWSFLLKNISEKEFDRTFFHPEHNRKISLDESTGMYAWHGNHHLAHITELKLRKAWR